MQTSWSYTAPIVASWARARSHGGVDFRGHRAKSLSVYVPRNGCP